MEGASATTLESPYGIIISYLQSYKEAYIRNAIRYGQEQDRTSLAVTVLDEAVNIVKAVYAAETFREPQK